MRYFSLALLLSISCSKDESKEGQKTPEVKELEDVNSSVIDLSPKVDDCGSPDAITQKIREAEGKHPEEGASTDCRLED